MKILLCLFTILLNMKLHAKNDYPIVLIHGFMGWGESEMGDYNYWGGSKDYVDMIKKNGNTVFTKLFKLTQKKNKNHLCSKKVSTTHSRSHC